MSLQRCRNKQYASNKEDSMQKMKLATNIKWLPTLLAGICLLAIQPLRMEASDWVVGDVFVAVADGCYNVYSNVGVFKEKICLTLDGLPGASDGHNFPPNLPRQCTDTADKTGKVCGVTAGCAFNPSLTKLYTTDFLNTAVVVYSATHPHPFQVIPESGVRSTESIVFDREGNFYVGHPD